MRLNYLEIHRQILCFFFSSWKHFFKWNFLWFSNTIFKIFLLLVLFLRFRFFLTQQCEDFSSYFGFVWLMVFLNMHFSELENSFWSWFVQIQVLLSIKQWIGHHFLVKQSFVISLQIVFKIYCWHVLWITVVLWKYIVWNKAPIMSICNWKFWSFKLQIKVDKALGFVWVDLRLSKVKWSWLFGSQTDFFWSVSQRLPVFCKFEIYVKTVLLLGEVSLVLDTVLFNWAINKRLISSYWVLK